MGSYHDILLESSSTLAVKSLEKVVKLLLLIFQNKSNKTRKSLFGLGTEVNEYIIVDEFAKINKIPFYVF